MKKAAALILALSLTFSLSLPALAVRDDYHVNPGEAFVANSDAKEPGFLVASQPSIGTGIYTELVGLKHTVYYFPEGTVISTYDNDTRIYWVYDVADEATEADNIWVAEDGREARVTLDNNHIIEFYGNDQRDAVYVQAPGAGSGASAKSNPFTDVEESDYFYDAVQWAYYAEPQITTGVSKTKFAPDSTVTRAQALTFLWRAKGKPAPESMVSPFTDVTNTKASYYKAVLWAVEQGITKGVSATKFGPAQKVTRSQMAVFLWRAENKPAVSDFSTAHAASITNATTKKAVAWADSLNLLDGTAKSFTANASCPRSDVVLYLYRYST